MASLSLYFQFETNLMSNRKVIELLLQLKSAKAHGNKYIKVHTWSAIFCVIVYSSLRLILMQQATESKTKVVYKEVHRLLLTIIFDDCFRHRSTGGG